jgi:hypothetical protein
MMNDLDKILGIMPATASEVRVEVDPGQQKVDDDFEFARTNLYNILNNGATALEELTTVASQSQHPRAYEALSGLIKTLSEANKDLLEINKQLKDLKKGEATPENDPSVKTINNNLFVGSTNELQSMIERIRNPNA